MEQATALVERVRQETAASMRRAIRYDGEAFDVLYHRDDVAEAYTDAEHEEVAKNLVLKGYDDAPHQGELARYGALDATVRWFEQAVVVQVPFGEWTGVVCTFDREAGTDPGRLTGAVLAAVEAQAPTTPSEPDRDLEEAVDEHFG